MTVPREWTLKRPVPRHGTDYAYRECGCRCSECTAVNAQRMRAQVARRRAEGLAVDDPRHGKYTTYVNWACRCDPCTQADRQYKRQLKKASR